jgi:hypothetical protein
MARDNKMQPTFKLASASFPFAPGRASKSRSNRGFTGAFASNTASATGRSFSWPKFIKKDFEPFPERRRPTIRGCDWHIFAKPERPP